MVYPYIRIILKRLSIIVLSALVTFTIQSQHVSYIDSLYRNISKATGSDLLDTYKKLAWEYRKNQPDSTIFYSEQAISLSKKIGSDSTISDVYNFIGLAFHYKGNDALAFDYFKSAGDMSGTAYAYIRTIRPILA